MQVDAMVDSGMEAPAGLITKIKALKGKIAALKQVDTRPETPTDRKKKKVKSDAKRKAEAEKKEIERQQNLKDESLSVDIPVDSTYVPKDGDGLIMNTKSSGGKIIRKVIRLIEENPDWRDKNGNRLTRDAFAHVLLNTDKEYQSYLELVSSFDAARERGLKILGKLKSQYSTTSGVTITPTNDPAGATINPDKAKILSEGDQSDMADTTSALIEGADTEGINDAVEDAASIVDKCGGGL